LISAEEGSAPPDSANLYVPSARAGHRAPHVWLASGNSLYDLLGQGFTLLCTAPGGIDSTHNDAVRRAAATLPQLAIVEVSEPAVADLYKAAFVLIRPDQHIAWRGDALDSGFEAAVLRTTGHVPERKPGDPRL
jgi:hypothetical protein